MRRDAVFVHPNPRTNQQHGRAGRAQKIRNDRADEQKNNIGQRRRLAFHMDVNAAGNHKQRADEHNKADIIVRHVEHAV